MVRSYRQSNVGSSNGSLALVMGLLLLAFFFYYFSQEIKQDKHRGGRKARSVQSDCCSLPEDPTQNSSSAFSPMVSPASSVLSIVTAISDISSSAQTAISRKAEEVKSLPNLVRRRSPISAKGSSSAPVSTAEEASILGTPSCDCRVTRDAEFVLRDDEAIFKKGVVFHGLPTKTKPYNFAKYERLNLLLMSDNDLQTGLSSAARELEKEEEENVLTAFRPILQCVVYSAKHASLLDHLAGDYMYLGED